MSRLDMYTYICMYLEALHVQLLIHVCAYQSNHGGGYDYTTHRTKNEGNHSHHHVCGKQCVKIIINGRYYV